MSKLSQGEIDAAVSKSLNTLDPSGEQQQGLKPYSETIGTFNILGNSYPHRIIKKLSSPFVKLHKKIYSGYYDQQTRVDTYLFNETSLIQKRVDDLPVLIDEKIYETHKLIDKFKKEILFELVDLKGGPAASSEYKKPETKIINQDRAKELTKVNIGCGTDIKDDYINIDHRAIDGVDVVADVLDLPFEEDSLDEIFASHVVEHFIQKDLVPVIQYWYSLLKKGGQLRLILPNIEDMAKRYAHGDITWEQFRSVTLGGQDYASDYHFNHFSVGTMKDFINETLPSAKFVVVEPSRKNGEAYEMEVLVKK